MGGAACIYGRMVRRSGHRSPSLTSVFPLPPPPDPSILTLALALSRPGSLRASSAITVPRARRTRSRANPPHPPPLRMHKPQHQCTWSIQRPFNCCGGPVTAPNATRERSPINNLDETGTGGLGGRFARLRLDGPLMHHGQPSSRALSGCRRPPAPGSML